MKEVPTYEDHNPPFEELEDPECADGRIIREGERFVEGQATPATWDPRPGVQKVPAGPSSKDPVRIIQVDLYRTEREIHAAITTLQQQVLAAMESVRKLGRDIREIRAHLEALDRHKVDLVDFEAHKDPAKHPH